MPLRHLKWPQNAGVIGAPLGGNRANPGKHPRGNSEAISGAIGAPPGGNWDPPRHSMIKPVANSAAYNFIIRPKHGHL